MKTVKTLVLAGLSVIGVFFIYVMMTADYSSTKSNQYKRTGEEGFLSASSANVVVPVTQQDLDRAIELGVANDDLGIAQMVATGHAFIVPQNTRVKVIQTTMTTTEVRILSGDFTGKSGWVPKEFVK